MLSSFGIMSYGRFSTRNSLKFGKRKISFKNAKIIWRLQTILDRLQWSNGHDSLQQSWITIKNTFSHQENLTSQSYPSRLDIGLIELSQMSNYQTFFHFLFQHCGSSQEPWELELELAQFFSHSFSFSDNVCSSRNADFLAIS